MARLYRKGEKKAGAAPGTLVHIGERKAEKVRISIIDYGEEEAKEIEVKNIEECFPFKETPSITWINVDGLHEIDIIEHLGNAFGLHPVNLEDILNTWQRPKLDDYVDYLYIVLKMLQFNDETNEVTIEQVSLILGHKYVISFQEREGDVFDPVRERIKNKNTRIRKMNADYLCYALMDAVVDHYFVVLEKLGEKIELLEEEVVKSPSDTTLQTLHKYKREITLLRRSIWPLREVVNRFDHSESSIVRKTTHVYLRDLYDHTIQVIDTVETFRDLVSGMLDIYLSSISNRMNEVMKVLTIIATIFIPLTFIAGVYGMNFHYMPELGWRWAYPCVWIFMITVAFIMFLYFKRKKWL